MLWYRETTMGSYITCCQCLAEVTMLVDASSSMLIGLRYSLLNLVVFYASSKSGK